MPIGSKVSTLLIDVKKSDALTDIASPRTGVKGSGKLWCIWSWRHSIDKIPRCQCIQELMRERKDMVMRGLHDEVRDKSVSCKPRAFITRMESLMSLALADSDSRRSPRHTHLDHTDSFNGIRWLCQKTPEDSLSIWRRWNVDSGTSSTRILR